MKSTCKVLRGQGYDGVAAMNDISIAAQAIVREAFPKAIYVHCAAHNSFLALSNAFALPRIRKCTGMMTISA